MEPAPRPPHTAPSVASGSPGPAPTAPVAVPTLADRLFWPLVAGGAASIHYGAAALVPAGLAALLLALHHAGRPRRFRRLVRRLVAGHAEALALRRRQEVFADAYGTTVLDGWVRERAYFAERVLRPRLAERGFPDYAGARWGEVLPDLLRLVEAAARSDAREDEAPEDGIAYERYCAGLLEAGGWRARPTSASGDQGADVVAEREGTRLVLQCKRLGKPAGNAAVQEAVAARGYWSAHEAGVVSASGYTPSARRLAAATGVRLLHHDDLTRLRPGRPAGE